MKRNRQKKEEHNKKQTKNKARKKKEKKRGNHPNEFTQIQLTTVTIVKARKRKGEEDKVAMQWTKTQQGN
jgi:hypothetical protein